MHGKPFVLAILTVSLGLAGCAKEAPSAAPEPAPSSNAEPLKVTSTTVKPLAKTKFGGEITEKTATGLDALLKSPTQYADKTVRTEGRVTAVCKSMGCWMELGDDAGLAHIKMAGHSFFVPKDASGHRAIVQGKVLRPSNDECSQEAKEQTGQVAKIEIEATGVEFID